MARPSKFKPEYIAIAEAMCKLGATDAELADAFDITVTTLNRWKAENEAFCASIKLGKEPADARVERSLFARATGYEHPDTDIRVIEGQIVETHIIKRYPPDTTAAIFWLKNRKREEWRDKVTNEHTGADGGAIEHDMTLTVSFVKADRT